MKVLSLFDGMSCGMIAMMKMGYEIERYVAYEIDKYAIQTSTHNFPMIEQCGDVFQTDFTKYEGFDFLIGGSPCTYWSIAQTKNRETTASGLGWELFSQYVRALHEAKPKFFIYENNKSMSKDIRASITETFGFEPICINSALVSAQNRQRLYWVGIRQDDETYKKADIEQPEDRGILIKDILDINPLKLDKPFERISNRNDGVVAMLNIKGHEIVRRVYGINGKCQTLTTSQGGYRQPKVLIDEYIHKLTVKECMRLQTVPEWYEFPVSNSQAYKMLGNGWTVDVIAHILEGLEK